MFELSETISKEFFEFILGKYALSPDGNHGPEHWKRVEADITVQTCWDSDRLDLGRAGINPLPRYLCTDYAKQSDILDSAFYRSIGEKPPY